MKQSQKHTYLAVFLVLQIVFLKIIATKPMFIEKYYSTMLFPFISKVLRTLFGWIPFSIGDLLYLVLALLILKKITLFLRKKKRNYSAALLKITAGISIAYFLFHLFWGLNYYRIPLSQKIFKTTQKKVDSTALYAFTTKIIAQTNALQSMITKDTILKVTMPYSFQKTKEQAVQSYTVISKELSFLEYGKKSIKHSLFSLPLTYMGFSGYINPFSLEAQINGMHTKVNKPTTILHEMSHQLGFAAENEANFIACVTALKSKDLYFKYAGSFMAMRHCLHDVYRFDKQKYKRFYATINKGVIANLQELRDFNETYKNPLEPVFKIVYHQFLKANNQPHGIQSYSYMVSLLMAYDQQQNNLLSLH